MLSELQVYVVIFQSASDVFGASSRRLQSAASCEVHLERSDLPYHAGSRVCVPTFRRLQRRQKKMFSKRSSAAVHRRKSTATRWTSCRSVLRISYWFVLLQLRSLGMLYVHGRRRLARRSTGIICSGSGALFLPLRRSAFMDSIIAPTPASRALSLSVSVSLCPSPPIYLPAIRLQYAVRCLQLHRRRDERECRHGLDRCQQPGHPSARMQGAAQHRRRGMQMHGDAQKCSSRQSGINHGGDRACRLELPHESFVLHAYFERISMASKPSHSSLLPGRPNNPSIRRRTTFPLRQ